MTAIKCPGCGSEIEEDTDECPECGRSLDSFMSEDNQDEAGDPSNNNDQQKESSQGDPSGEGNGISEDETSPLNEDELDLIQQLKERINGAKSELEDNLDDELDSLAKRVTGVVDSVDRIESMDHPKPEEILYKENEKRGSAQKEETEGASPEEEFRDDPSVGPDISGNVTEVKIIDDHFDVSSESPYDEIKKIIDSSKPFQTSETSYRVETSYLVSSMIELANLKRMRGKDQEALELLNMARDLKPDDDEISKRIEEMGGVPDDTSGEDESGEDKEAEKEREKTKVLAPELEEEISALERRASSTLQQAENLMKSNSLPQDRFDDFSNKILSAKQLFNEKRFHKSHEISLEIIEDLRGMIKENLDRQTQSNIDRSREMLEDIKSGDFDIPPDTMDRISEDFDKAVKSYLTDDFERANLLSKKVISKILEFSEPEGVELRKEISSVRDELKGISETSLLEEHIEELNKLLTTAEDLIDKRDYEGAKKVISRSTDKLSEIKTSKQLYYSAKEIQIKLNNKIERFDPGDIDVADIKRKLVYLNKMFDQGRYEDVITLGGDIEKSIDGLEITRKEKEAKGIKNELDNLMVYVDEMDSPASIKKRFQTIKSKYDTGELDYFLQEGNELLRELKNKMKTISMTRGKRIATSIIDARMYISRMRSLNVDTIDFERRVRKGKNLIKEGNFIEGIKLMDRVNSEMHERISHDTKYLKDYVDIHRDALSAILDRYRTEPCVYLIRRRKMPLLRKLAELGKYRKALEMYKDLEINFSDILTKNKVRSVVETQLTECKFELYKKKDQGFDIAEPLKLYTHAQRRLKEGDIISAEYLIEISRRYCENFMSAA